MITLFSFGFYCFCEHLKKRLWLPTPRKVNGFLSFLWCLWLVSYCQTNSCFRFLSEVMVSFKFCFQKKFL